MCPVFRIFGIDIPAYWVCALVGAVFCAALLFIRHKRFSELKQVDVTNCTALAIVGLVIGGRILYLITVLPDIIRYWDKIISDLSVITAILSNGMVFYGGMFGAAIAVWLYTSTYHLDKKVFFDYITPAFPLFHAFGRIGCFLTGCCHGVKCERYGIAFKYSISSANGIPYFPVQLLGSILEIILFVILFFFEKKHPKTGMSFPLYITLYSIGRFFVEFLRGDAVRGIWLGLSTSQWISIGVLIVICLYMRKNPHKRIQ